MQGELSWGGGNCPKGCSEETCPTAEYTEDRSKLPAESGNPKCPSLPVFRELRISDLGFARVSSTVYQAVESAANKRRKTPPVLGPV